MSDWRPYEPSLEAERSAVYERAAGRALRLPNGHTVLTREEAILLFGAGSELADVPLPFMIVRAK